jgi:hypothetical protein
MPRYAGSARDAAPDWAALFGADQPGEISCSVDIVVDRAQLED